MRWILLACLCGMAGGAAWLLGSGLSSPAPDATTGQRVTTMVARDSSGNGHDALIQGPVRLGLPGRHGSSFSFEERDSWLLVPSSPDLNPGDHDFLMSAWILMEESPGPGETYDVIRKGIAYTVPGQFRLEVLRHGRVMCTAEDAAGRIAEVTTSKVNVIDRHWHRVGCARTGRHWSVIVDDTVESRRIELGAVANEVPLAIGAKYGSEDRPDGRVDEVTFVLGQPYRGTVDHGTRLAALQHAAPTARWHLDETSSTRAFTP